jgi:hypothetical protein
VYDYIIIGGESVGSGHRLPPLFRECQQGQLCEAGPGLTAQQAAAEIADSYSGTA